MTYSLLVWKAECNKQHKMGSRFFGGMIAPGSTNANQNMIYNYVNNSNFGKICWSIIFHGRNDENSKQVKLLDLWYPLSQISIEQKIEDYILLPLLCKIFMLCWLSRRCNFEVSPRDRTNMKSALFILLIFAKSGGRSINKIQFTGYLQTIFNLIFDAISTCSPPHFMLQ